MIKHWMSKISRIVIMLYFGGSYNDITCLFAVVVVFLKLWSGILTGDLNSGYLVALAGVVVDDQERLGKAVVPTKLPFEPTLVFIFCSAGSSQNDTVSDISGGSKLL